MLRQRLPRTFLSTDAWTILELVERQSKTALCANCLFISGSEAGFRRSGGESYLDRLYWALNLACHALDAVILPDRV